MGSGDQTPGSGVRRCWRLVAAHIGHQTTHRARGCGRGYSEAGVRGSTQASPRAAGPPTRGLGGCPPDPSPSGGGRGPCAPRSSARAEGRSEGAGVGGGVAAQRRPRGRVTRWRLRAPYRGGGDTPRLRAGLLPAAGAARHPPASTHRPGSETCREPARRVLGQRGRAASGEPLQALQPTATPSCYLCT